MIKIWLDVSGWDKWPEARIEWAIKALEIEHKLEMILYWNKTHIEEILNDHLLFYSLSSRIEIVNSENDIPMDTKDNDWVKNNKKASMSLLIKDLVLDKEWKSILDAWITAWNTWVWIMGSFRKIKTLKIDSLKLWQALGAFIPNQHWTETLVMDFWATIMWNTKEKIVKAYLSNAMLGISYLKSRWIENPKLWLINIWEEESKWSLELQEVYKKLKELVWDNFVWNIEWTEILNTHADILLTDATTWNHILKMWEWVVKNIWGELKKLFESNIFFKIIGLLVKTKIKEIFSKYESKETGGALTLWLNNLFYITHWTADSELIKFAVLNAYRDAEKWVRKKIKNELELLVKSLPEELREEVWKK